MVVLDKVKKWLECKDISTKVPLAWRRVTEEDKELIELLGLQADGVNDINDEHNIRGLPRGESFDWSKPANVSQLCGIP